MKIAGLFGIGPDAAFAMALLVHVMILTVTSIGGIVAYLALRHVTPPVTAADAQTAAAADSMGTSPG